MPLEGPITSVKISTRVVLPAPFLPSRPKICLFCIVKLKLFRALNSPYLILYFFTRFDIFIIVLGDNSLLLLFESLFVF